MKKFKNKNINRLIIVITILFGLILFLNIIIESILKKAVKTELDSMSQESEYVLGIKDLDVNIFLGNISIIGVYAKPTASLFKSFAEGETNRDVLKQVVISQISLSGLELIDFFINKELLIDRIEIESLYYDFFRPEKKYQITAIKDDYEASFSLDSIRIPGIDKIDLTAMQIANYGIHVIDASSMDTLSLYQGKELLFSGLSMNQNNGENGYFNFDTSKLELQLKQQEFNLQNELYAVSFGELHYEIYNKEIRLIDFQLQPILSQIEFSSRFNRVYLRNECKIDTLIMTGIDSNALFDSGIISIDHIDINGLLAKTFMDKSKPWDMDRMTKMPQEFLANMGQPLHVNGVTINNSSFYYSEKLANTNDLVKFHFENLKGEINNITSIGDSLNRKKSLDLKLNGNFLNVLPVAIQINMPYKTDAFYVSGSTKNTADFTHLNPIIFPALGMKFENGTLDGVQFNFKGNSKESEGELTMLFEDLEVEIFKKNLSENKKVSWIANAFMKRSNPNKNGRTVTADINFERLKYKQFANYIWKSIQSGVVNSIMPFGKRRKTKNGPQKE